MRHTMQPADGADRISELKRSRNSNLMAKSYLTFLPFGWPGIRHYRFTAFSFAGNFTVRMRFDFDSYRIFDGRWFRFHSLWRLNHLPVCLCFFNAASLEFKKTNKNKNRNKQTTIHRPPRDRDFWKFMCFFQIYIFFAPVLEPPDRLSFWIARCDYQRHWLLLT